MQNSPTPAQELDFLLAQLDALAEARASGLQREAVRSFVRHYYETSSLDALKLRSPQELVDIAHAHWGFAARRMPGEGLVRVTPPAVAAGGAALARLSTCTDDMPFLVDSVSMAVRGAGSTIDWTAHPVLHLRRNAQGELNGAASEGAAESWIHMEFEALAGAAAYPQLEESLNQVLTDLRTVVEDYEAMRARAQALAAQFDQAPKAADAAEFSEAAALLRWLDDGHFTLLGYAETELRQNNGKAHFVGKGSAALGLSRKGARFSDPEQLIAPNEELDKYADSPRLVVLTKAALKSPVRHPEYMDVISFKLFKADGSRAGTARLIGLFSSEAYLEKPSSIPVIRRKVAYVTTRARLPQDSHSGKNLKLILNSLPRDELFQSGEEELFATCMGIRALRERQQLKLFMRRDRYGRYFSGLVYVLISLPVGSLAPL